MRDLALALCLFVTSATLVVHFALMWHMKAIPVTMFFEPNIVYRSLEIVLFVCIGVFAAERIYTHVKRLRR